MLLKHGPWKLIIQNKITPHADVPVISEVNSGCQQVAKNVCWAGTVHVIDFFILFLKKGKMGW